MRWLTRRCKHTLFLCKRAQVNQPRVGTGCHPGSQGQQGAGPKQYTEQGSEAPSAASCIPPRRDIQRSSSCTVLPSSMSIKISNDTIGNRTRDLPACRAVPQLTAPPREGEPVSPVLFSLYANDMPVQSHHVKLALYADDTAIIATSRKPALLVSYLEAYLSGGRENGGSPSTSMSPRATQCSS